MADERKIPGSALDVGENAVSNEAADIERDGINANEAPGESREEHSARIKREKQASFEYADNYRQKLKEDAANRRKTPAQLRKQAEKEAAIAREKEEREREIREAIEREKEEAVNRAESAAALRDQVEKSLAEKKALEEAEREALKAAAEEPVEEPVSEDLAEEPAEEPVDEAPEEEPVDEEEYDEEELDEDEDFEDEDYLDEDEDFEDEDYLDEDEDEYYEEEDEEPVDMELFIDPDNLDGEPAEESFGEPEEEDDLVTIKYGDEDEESAEEALDDDDNMVLTFDPEDVVFVTPDEPEEAPVEAPAPVAEEPVEEAPEEAPAEAPVRKPKAAKAPEAAAPKKTKKRRKPKKAKKAPKKAVATPKKPVAKKAPKDALVAPIVPVVSSEKGVLDDEIARLLEENKELLRENIEELRRRQAELERRQDELEDAARASAEEAEAPESPEEAIAEPAVEDELLAAPESPEEAEELSAEPEALPEEKAEAPRVISEDHENKKVFNRGVRSGVVEEIPESEMIINYMGGEEAGYAAPVTDGITYIGAAGDETPSAVAPLATAAVAATGLALLSPALLKKKIKDNDSVVSGLKKKLAEADKQYRLAKDKDEKLERLAECAEYQRSILDCDAESLEATKALGKNTDKRKSALQKDISRYNAYAQKLEKRSMTQVPQAPTSLADDILAGRPYTKLPPIIQKDDDDDGKDVKAPMSYISQVDNDPNSIIGGAQPAAKRKLSKAEVKRSARELKQKMRENDRLLKENRKDLTEQLERAKAAEHNQKTEHLVSALNYQREIVAILGDSYEAAARTGDLAEAKKISRQIDKEVDNYNKLAKSVENRTGETLPRAYNTYAKDIADNRQSKLPPVVKYGAAANIGSFTDSEDVLVIRRVDPVEQLGTEKILKVGEETRTANQTQPAVYTDNLGAIMVTPPAGNEGQVIVVGDPKTVPVETVKALTSKAYQIKEESRETPAAAVAPTIVYVQPAPAAEPEAAVQGTETVRPLASRIVESEEGRKVIAGTAAAEQTEEAPESLTYNMVEKAEEPEEAKDETAADEYVSLTAIGAPRKGGLADVKVDDSSKVIPIIINPDDNPIAAYVVTDSELLKGRFAAGKGESAISEGTIVVGSATEQTEEAAPVIPVAEAPVEEVAEEAVVKSRLAEETEEEEVAAPEESVVVLADAPVESAPVKASEVSVDGEYGEAKLESIDVEAPAEEAPVEAAPAEKAPAEKAPVEEAPVEEPTGTAVDLEKVIVKTAQPGYIVIEERPAPVAEEPKVKTEEVVAAETDTYVLKEHIPVEEAITPEAHMPAEEQIKSARPDEAPVAAPAPTEEATPAEEATPTEEAVAGEIKEYPPMEAAEEETGVVTVLEDEVSGEPEVFVIYGKKKPEAKAEGPEVVETRVLKAPKAKGRYELTEGERAVRTEEAPAEDEILHVGEEIVTVLEDEAVAEAPVAEVTEEKKLEGKVIMAPKAKGRYTLVAADRKTDEPVAEVEKTEAPADDEIVHVGEEIVTVVEDQPVAEESAPATEEKKVYTGYVLTENSEEIKIISGKQKGRGYTLTEDPDVAKRIEAASNAEIEKGKYSIVVSNEQAKTIEGKAGVKYTITEREDGKKVITFEKLPKAPRPEEKVEDEIVHTGEETVTVVEEEIPAVYSELTAISDAPAEEAKAEPAKAISNTLVVGKAFAGEKAEAANDIKILNAPKSSDKYVIAEKVDSARVIAGKEESAIRKVEAHDDQIKVIPATEEKKNRVVTEIPEDTRVIAKAPVEHTVTVLPEETRVITEATKAEETRVITETPKAEEKKSILEENKVRNTAKGQNAYAILEKRDSAKVITGVEKEEPVAEQAVAEQLVAVEAPKAEPIAEPKVEEKKESSLIIPAGTKILTTPKAKEKYLIIESRGPVKTITAPEEVEEETPAAVKELLETEKVATIRADKPKAAAEKASIFKVRKSRGELKRLTKPGKPGVYVELDSERIIPKREEEKSIEDALIYLNEREGGIRTAAEIAHADPNKLSKYELRKTKGELKRLTKENKPGVYVELNSERIIPKRGEETFTEDAPIYLNEREGGIRTAADVTDPNKVSKYVVRRTRGELKRLTKENKPGVYVELNSEKVIRPDDFKMPEEALVYVNVNERIKTVQAEEGVKEKLKEKIDIYKGSEHYVHGVIPVVDVLIDPYKNLNMGILSEKDLKKHLAESQKEINHLKHDLKQAEKSDKAESDTDRLLALISKINTQCLICETYVTRINVCNNCDAFDEAKENADILSRELNVYNDYITEFNKITSMKVPLAEKSLPKRVLNGEAFEHLARISHNLIEEEGLKTKKRKSKIKLIEDHRYKADINLLNRRDAETKNSVSVVENRYIFETALLKGEKDILEFKFAKNSTRANSRKAYIARKLRTLKGAKERAVRYEVEDNNRYYRVLTCDTNLESYKNNNAKKTKVTKIVSNVSQLLRERDEINSKLNAIYSGPLGDIVGATESEKWRDVKVTAAKSHAKKLRDKANALKNSVPGFGEEKAERIYAFNSLLDAKVEALATIDLCNYRLTKEKNSLAEIASIRKDLANAKKQIRLIDAEIKERKNIIKEEYYGPDGSADIIALVAIVLLGIVGLILVAGFFGLDLIGFIKPLLEKLADMIKGFLN